MNLELLIVWTICLSCLSLLIRAIGSPYHRGWSVVSGGILAIALSLATVSLNLAILVGGGLWAILIVLPLLGFARVNKLTFQHRYRDARRLADRLRWLHPADGWLEQPQVLRALELGQNGAVGDAIALLQPYATEPTPFGRNAAALQYVMEARWDQLRAWIEQHIPERTLAQDPNLLTYYLRSLGETGDLNALLTEGERFLPILERGGNAIALNWVRMLILAFCGRSESVIQLFEKSLSIYGSKVQKFWVLTALMASGEQRAAREQLLALSTSHDTLFNNTLTWRLSHPPVLCDRVLTHTSHQILLHLSHEYKQEISYSRILTFFPSKAYITYTLISLNLLFFAYEIYGGGSENLETLYHLGALVPLEVKRGQWWRLINANFLHFGWVHLATNMLGLYLLGPFVEFQLKPKRYFIVYCTSGIGSMLAFTWVAFQSGTTEQLLVGASASIMGLIGATAAILLHGYWIKKSRIAARRLQFIALIILLQILFDFSIPGVSFLAHTVGLIVGFLTAFLFLGFIQ